MLGFLQFLLVLLGTVAILCIIGFVLFFTIKVVIKRYQLIPKWNKFIEELSKPVD